MANTLANLPSYRPRTSILLGASMLPQCDGADFQSGAKAPEHPSDSFPCVLYELNASLELIYLSANGGDLLGIAPGRLPSGRRFWDERIPLEDLRLFLEKFEQLKETGFASLIHRVLDNRGLPRWVAHSFRKIQANGDEIICGCLIPMRDEPRLKSLEQGVVSRFIHKLGNQFQLLNLAVHSLQKDLQESKAFETVQQSVEKAIELTRTFSDYSQGVTCVSEANLFEILNTAVVTRRSLFAARGVRLEVQIDDSVGSVTIASDPFLLESAIGGILQNAVEATDRGGKVVLKASVDACQAAYPLIARLSVADTGCGIREDDLGKITVPFYTSKKDHDGLGLSMAARLFAMLGGVLRVNSLEGKGTEITIVFPANTREGLSDR